MRIGELSRRSGFTIKTLRYYDDIGLVRPSRRDPSSRFREYGARALDSLSLVRSAKVAGLNLSQIRLVLSAARRGQACREVIPLLDGRVREIDEAIRSLSILKERLLRALKTGITGVEKKECRCPVLDSLGRMAQS